MIVCGAGGWKLETGKTAGGEWRGSDAFCSYIKEKSRFQCLPPTLKALPSAAILHNAIYSSFSFLCSSPSLSLLFCLRPRSSLRALCTVRDVWQASSCGHHLVDSHRGPVRFQCCRYQRHPLRWKQHRRCLPRRCLRSTITKSCAAALGPNRLRRCSRGTPSGMSLKTSTQH